MVANRSRQAGADDWKASWIWCEGESRPRNFYLYARRTFKLPAKPASGSLRITADSRYKVFVNGAFVGSGPVPSDPRRLSYDTYDITQFLTKGQNAIAIVVHHLGQGTYSYIPGPAGVICQADIEWHDGSEVVLTDGSWRVLPAAWTSAGARMNRRLGFQEVYDARLEPQGWKQAGFNDSKWPQAVVVGKPNVPPFGRLVPRQIPHLREEVAHPTAVVSIHDSPPLPHGIEMYDLPHFMATEELRPVKQGRAANPERLVGRKDDPAIVVVPESGGVTVVLEFGREVSGCVELAIPKSAGGIVDIGYSELLEGGRVRPDRGDVRYTDRLILRQGAQTWCSFEPRAFRYIQLDFRSCPRPVSVRHVLVRESTYPVELRGSFESSDDLLNRIWKTGAETVRLCMQDTYIDAPRGDRAQWWDTAAAASRIAYYAFGDTALLAQGLGHIAQSQRSDGAVMALYPGAAREVFPDFAALWAMSMWDYYTQSQDRELLTDLYPALTRWLQWIGRFSDRDGMLSDVEGNVFIDWAEIDRRGEICALNCLYLGALRAASQIALLLHRISDAEQWAGAASALRIAIAKHFWSARRGLFADSRVSGKLEEHYSRQTNILAALFDVPDHYERSSIYRQMLRDEDLPPLPTPNFASLLAEALFRSGWDEAAVDLIRRKWGEMISAGATTFWEYFSTEGHLCHAWSAGPTYQLQAYVLGVRPTGEPGRVLIEPHPADLAWAKGVVPTAAGPVGVDWKATIRDFTITVHVPQGVTAEIAPPRKWPHPRVILDGRDVRDGIVEVGAGIHVVRVLSQHALRPRHRQPEPEQVEERHPLPIPPGRGDIETVEQMIRILSQLDREQTSKPEPESQAEAEQPAEVQKRPRRRPRRGRAGQAAAETPPEAQETAEEPHPAPQEAPKPAAEPERRRPRRRRRPPRTPTQEPPEQHAAPASAEEAPQEPVREEQAPLEAEAKPVSQRHHRPRRRRRKPPAQAVQATSETMPEPQPEDDKPTAPAPSTDSDLEPAEDGRKPRRRHHRRRRPAPGHETVETA